MKKISARLFFLKKVFPAIWFGFLAFFFATSLTSGAGNASAIFIIAPAMMAILGYVLMKKILWDLVDEVYDCGSYLLVKNRNQEDKINLSDIMNVSVTTMMNPPRISLRLRVPGKFGNEVAFSPISGGLNLIPFSKNAIAEDLIVRVDNANRSALNKAA